MPGGPTGTGGLAGVLGGTSGYDVQAPDQSLYAWQGPSQGQINDQRAAATSQQGVTADFGQAQGVFGQQGALAQQLLATANGTGGPSAADLQLKQGADMANDQALSLAKSGRGAQSAGAQYAAMRQAANTNATTNAALGVQRANEATQARGELAGLYGQQSQEAMGQAQFQAQQQQQQNLANQQVGLGYTNAGINAGAAQTQAGEAYGSAQLAAESQNAETSRANAAANQAVAGGAANGVAGAAGAAIGALGSLSDVNAKSDIQPAGGFSYVPPQQQQPQLHQANPGMSATTGASQVPFQQAPRGPNNVPVLQTQPSRAAGASRQLPPQPPTPNAGGLAGAVGITSDASEKFNVNPAGAAALANMDAHTANFNKMPAGLQAWYNASNAQPWTPAAEAGQEQVNQFSFTSDPDTKTDVSSAGAADVVGNEKRRLDALTAAVASQQTPQAGGGGGFNPIGSGMSGFSTGQSLAKGFGGPSSDNGMVSVQNQDGSTSTVAYNPGDSFTGEGSGDISSDKRGKDVLPGGHTVADAFLDTLKPATYRYKDARENGGEQRLGIMAQDVEQSPTGHDIVKDGPKGKYLEGGATLSSALAGLGRLKERLEAVETSLDPKVKKKLDQARAANSILSRLRSQGKVR